jgi:chemotaxis protein methyltransferase CheR
MTAIVKNISSTEAEFRFSDKDFELIAGHANERYGLFLQPSKKSLVYSRLAKRLRALNLPNFESYCDLISGPEADAEQSHLLSALTTNVTHFFREMHHFEFLQDTVTPEIMKKAKSGQKVRLWSAACSAGQEAYSMAASLLTAAPEIAQLDVKILATDIDPKVLNQAKLGRYSSSQLEAIPKILQSRMLTDRVNTSFEIEMRHDLRSMISFAELNLMDSWPIRRKFDVIFCRNAAIYFDKETQSRLWTRFADHLVEGGKLMIGHSERLNGPATSAFESIGITTYAKKTHAGIAASPQRKIEE